jgi:hypothetical protein
VCKRQQGRRISDRVQKPHQLLSTAAATKLNPDQITQIHTKLSGIYYLIYKSAKSQKYMYIYDGFWRMHQPRQMWRAICLCGRDEPDGIVYMHHQEGNGGSIVLDRCILIQYLRVKPFFVSMNEIGIIMSPP